LPINSEMPIQTKSIRQKKLKPLIFSLAMGGVTILITFFFWQNKKFTKSVISKNLLKMKESDPRVT
jgi:hypothetical protein